MRTLSAVARRVAAEAGLRLRAFARAGDRLWLLAPVAPEVAGRQPWPPGVVLETGRLEALPPAGRLIAWGEGPRVAALRARWRARPEVDRARALDAPLHEALWHLPVSAPEVVARASDRGFALELSRERDWALPGAHWVADPAELQEQLGRGAATAGGGRWVVKAPFAAAGRERHVGSGTGDLDDPRVRRRLERLFERHGRLLFEPWVQRTTDFGAAGFVTAGGVRLASLHRQEVDAAGGFRRILPAAVAGRDGLTAAERDLLEAAFHAAADRLRSAGYTGPFGIDAFRWQAPRGGPRFHPLCEINPRLTFGLVARAWAERATGAGREGHVSRMLSSGDPR